MPLTSFDRYRRDIRHARVLHPETERALARRWAAGDRSAAEQLIEACLPFVISIARKYRRWGVPFEDLVQQGNFGLLRAAEKFDPDRDVRLVTYSATWIRGEIRDYVTKTHRIVRVGTTHTERAALRRYRDGGATCPEDLAATSGMPLARSRQLWALLAARDASLDASTDGGDAGVERMAGDALSPEDALAAREERAAISAIVARALASLDARERRVVEARMISDEPRTLAELGAEMGVSRERVRQLEVRARSALKTALSEVRGWT